MERPGPKNQFSLLATNRNARPKCEDSECLICTADKGGYCRAKEIVYELKCECGMAYDGQTGRNGLTRGREHTDKVKSQDPKKLKESVIDNHQQDEHNGTNTKWQMKVIKRFPKKPLDRQIFESIKILKRPAKDSLNSKVELAKS